LPELITWAGRTLSGSDRFGEWAVTGELEGWWDSPEIKGETQDRPYQDGEFDLPVYNQARIITINGNLRAKSHQQLHEAGDFLTGPISGRLTVTGHGSARWADAKRNSGVKFTPVTDVFAQWQVRLKCVDPRKFGESKTIAVATGSPVSAFHRGNYNAMPSFIIRGDMPGGYTITVNGWNYTVTSALVTGAPHRIDYNNGRLYRNGVLSQGNLGNTNTTPIPPGQSVAVGLYPVTTGSGSADMTITDTYI
jgi:hypothetical protein